MFFFSAGFVAFYVSSVVVFAFVSFSIVSFPMVYILTCSDLYIFGITLFRYTAYALRFQDLHTLKLVPFGVGLCNKVFTVLCFSLKPFPQGFVPLHLQKNTFPQIFWPLLRVFFLWYFVFGVAHVLAQNMQQHFAGNITLMQLNQDTSASDD